MNPLSIFKTISNNKDKIFSKDTFFGIIILGLVIYILFMQGCGGKKKDDQIEVLQKEILKLDKTVQESNGAYHKLVNNFATEKELRNQIEEFNKDLAKQLKKNDEKLLLVSQAVATFENKLDKGISVTVGRENGEETFNFITNYPDKQGEENFISYKGKVFTQSKKLDGEWSFNKLKLNVVLTEKPDGMWAYRIDGPDYFKVDSIKVNSLPKDKIAPENNKKVNLLVGAGYRTLLDFKSGRTISVNAGMEYKKNIVLIDASTNQYIGVTFLRKL